MRVEIYSVKYEIVAVDGGVGLGKSLGLASWLHEEDLSRCTLDLDSIWIGRPYRLKENHKSTCVVLMVNTDIVCFEGTGADLRGLRSVATRDNFLYYREPLPLETSSEESECPCVGVAKEIEKELRTMKPWPQPGDKGLWPAIPGKLFTLKYVDDEVSLLRDETGRHYVDHPGCLEPIPSEPPVKVGDIVLLARDPDEPKIAGTVTEVYPGKHEFYIANWGMSNWDDSRVTIAKLVPDTLYAKMRKRLEELRDNAKTSAPTQERLCKALLADLEAYAKEGQWKEC